MNTMRTRVVIFLLAIAAGFALLNTAGNVSNAEPAGGLVPQSSKSKVTYSDPIDTAAPETNPNVDLSIQSKTKTFYFPKIYGLRVDATVWEWDGTPGTHETAKRQAADMYCSYALEKDATSVRFEVVSSDRRGTERFKEDGSHSYCKFCKDFFSSVTCRASN